MDFETYSEAGYRFDPALGRFVPLQKGKPSIMGVNAAIYGAHKSTRVISLAYDVGSGLKLWIPGCNPPKDLFWFLLNGGTIEAHNAGFEYYIWEHVCHGRMGWPKLYQHRMSCSAAKARAWGLPGKLDTLGKILNSAEKKDKRGKQLINLLSKPKRPTKKCADLYRSREKYPDLHREMFQYNLQDTRSQQSVSAMMPGLSPFEKKVWLMDQEINARGVAIDTISLEACLEVFSQAEKKYTDELISITGGAVKGVGEISKKSAGDTWLISQGVDLPSLDKQHVKLALEYREMPDVCRRVLEIRQEIGGANVKKLMAMDRTCSDDGRIRELFIYCGAERTGRFAGRGSQPQNLKNSGPNCYVCPHCGTSWAADILICPSCDSLLPAKYSEKIEWCNETALCALNTLRKKDLALVEKQWGNAIEIIGSCLRTLFIAEDGKDLIGSDYSAIEAVVLACLAGETWRIDVFNTHGKIYEMSASKITGVPFEDFIEHKKTTGKHHPHRKKIGKVAELASGYGGYIRAWIAFGADKFMSEEEIKKNVLAWRKESPMVVEFWGGQWRKTPGKWEFTPEFYGLEGAAVSAVLYPGQCFKYRDISYGYDTSCDVLYCLLPSGRKLAYHKPRLTKGLDPRKLEVLQLSFKGWNSDSTKGPIGWTRIFTFGGKLAENVCQAVARDILVAAMLRVRDAGYNIVLHVHDEIISEILKAFGSIEEFEALMMIKEPWFADWPIKAAGGWRGRNFRK